MLMMKKEGHREERSDGRDQHSQENASAASSRFNNPCAAADVVDVGYGSASVCGDGN